MECGARLGRTFLRDADPQCIDLLRVEPSCAPVSKLVGYFYYWLSQHRKSDTKKSHLWAFQGSVYYRSSLVSACQDAGIEVAIETNGTLPAPSHIDWICVSPKPGKDMQQTAGHELKLVFPQTACPPEDFEHLDFTHFFLQPMDGPDQAENIQAAAAYCQAHPKWRLSLQTHKLIGLP